MHRQVLRAHRMHRREGQAQVPLAGTGGGGKVKKKGRGEEGEREKALTLSGRPPSPLITRRRVGACPKPDRLECKQQRQFFLLPENAPATNMHAGYREAGPASMAAPKGTAHALAYASRKHIHAWAGHAGKVPR